MNAKSQSKAPEKKTAWSLADAIIAPVGYAESMVSCMFDQLQSTDERQAINNIYACLDATNKYLKEIRQFCEEAQKGGK